MSQAASSTSSAHPREVETAAVDAKAPAPSFRRKRFWVSPGFQANLLAKLSFMAAIVMSLTMLLTVVTLFLMSSDAEQPEEMGRWWTYLGGMFFAFLVALSLVMWFGLMVTHRIAGPIYRTLQTLQSVNTGGDRRPVKFRKGDAFPELAEQLNKTVATLDSRREQARALAQSLEHDLSEAGQGAGSDSLRRARETAHELAKMFA